MNTHVKREPEGAGEMPLPPQVFTWSFLPIIYRNKKMVCEY